MQNRKIEILQKMSEQYETDACLVYSPQYHKENYRFLTERNFVGPFAAILYIAKTKKVKVFYTSEWDIQTNKEISRDLLEIILMDKEYAAFKDTISKNGIKSIAISGQAYLPFGVRRVISECGAELVSAEKYLPIARMQKTPEEIEYMKKAVSLADDAWKVFMEGVSNGLNEYMICAEVEHYIKLHGAEDCFMLLATGGKDIRGMTPPMMRVAKPGDMVRTEITPQVNGWWAQICRTCVKGKANDDQKRAFEIFLEAEQAGLDMIRPGVNIRDVAKAENDVFRKYGYGEFCTEKYTRVRGHGHGLDLDEMPLVLESTDLVLKKDMVVVIHPNTFHPLSGYMVFGDPVLITDNGYEMLSRTERKLFEV